MLQRGISWPMQRIGRALLLPAASVALLILSVAPLAEAQGTRALVEVHAGLASPPFEHLRLSLGYGIEVGYGGRLGGSPVRFYGVVGFDRAAYAATGTHPFGGWQWSTERSYYDMHVGLRMLVPVVWELRWYLEALAGASYLDGSLEREIAPRVSTSGWSALLVGATGLELRWHRHLATGIRGELRAMLGEPDALATVIGDRGTGRIRLTILASQSVMF